MKRVSKKIAFPPVWFSIIFIALSFGADGIVMYFQVKELAEIKAPFAYVVYLASAFGLYYLIQLTVVPLTKKIIHALKNGKYTARYFNDREFSARVGLYSGMALNIIYALFKLISGIIYRSSWFIAIAVYYFLLSIIRFTLIKNDIFLRRKNQPNMQSIEWRSYRNAGWLMLLINIALSGIIVQVILQNKSYSYPGTIIFIMALYAFYRLYLAIVGLMKDRQNRSPIISASRSINSCVAIVAMFTLQTAMLAQFSTASDFDRNINIITGTVVALIVTFTAVFMVVKVIVNRKRLGE